MKTHERGKMEGTPPEFAGSLVEAILSAAGDALLIADTRRSITFADQRFCRLTGRSLDDLLGRKVWTLFPASTRASFTSRIIQGLQKHERWSGEVECLCRRDTPRPFFMTVFQMGDSEGRPAGTAFVCSQRTSGEKSRGAASDRIYRSIVESMEDGVVLCDPHGAIVSCNEAFAALLGYSSSEIIGTSDPYPWIMPADRQKFRFGLRIFQKERRLRNYTVTCRRSDASPVVVSIAFSLIKDRGDGNSGILMSVRDITDVQYVDELRRTNERMHRLIVDVQKKAQRLQTLEMVNALVLDSADVSRIFRAVVGSIRQLVPHDLAGIYLYDPEKDRLVLHTVSKITSFTKALAKLHLGLGDGLVGTAALSGKVILVNNAERDSRSRYPGSSRPEKEHLIAVALKGRRSVYGVLVVARNADPPYIEEDGLVVKSFADATSVALENAHLLDELAAISGTAARSPECDQTPNGPQVRARRGLSPGKRSRG